MFGEQPIESWELSVLTAAFLAMGCAHSCRTRKLPWRARTMTQLASPISGAIASQRSITTCCGTADAWALAAGAC